MTAGHHGGTRDTRAAAMRRRLLAAAKAQAATGTGPEALSVARIARAAGVSRATFYIYFEGKPGLLHAWADEAIATFARACEPWMALDGTSTKVDVRTAVERIAVTYRANLALLSAARLAGARDRGLRSRLDGALGAATVALEEQLGGGQRQGWIDPTVPAREAAAWAMCMIDRGLEALPGEKDGQDLEPWIDSLAQLAWSGLFAGARASATRISEGRFKIDLVETSVTVLI